MPIAENIAKIRAGIRQAANAAGRDPSQILLCAATKMNNTQAVQQAIGYKEFLDALAGRCSVADATAQVQQASRHYAKRQLTWFRRNPNIHWLRRGNGESTGEILLRARQILADFDN